MVTKKRTNKRNKYLDLETYSPEYYKATYIKCVYGLSYTDYKAMFLAQEEKCAICKKEQKLFNTNLAVDHCHDTGKIRGLLCKQCNIGLGYFKDNPDILEAAVNYLKNN